jgi:hypothetical protein
MSVANLHLELVHDAHRNRFVVACTADPLLLRLAASRVVEEAEERAEQFAGIDDIAAAQERADAGRLRAVLALIDPTEAGA